MKRIAVLMLVVILLTGCQSDKDYSNSLWFKDEIEEKIELPGLNFYNSIAYSTTGIINIVYASDWTLSELRDHYIGQSESFEIDESNSDATIGYSGVINGNKVVVNNYYAEMGVLVDVVITLDETSNRDYLNLFRDEFLTVVDSEAITKVQNGNMNGGYFLYNFDTADPYIIADVLLISRMFDLNQSFIYDHFVERIKSEVKNVILEHDRMVRINGENQYVTVGITKDSSALYISTQQKSK